MTTKVVTELVVDASGAISGSAAYIRAMQAAEKAQRQQVDATIAAEKAAGRSVEVITGGASRIARAWESAAKAADPLIASQKRLEAATLAADNAMRRGLATPAQASQVIATLRQRHQELAEKLDQGRKTVGLAAHEYKNLGFQVNDVATMLASGSSPFQVLATQGGQVLQILQSGNGGITGSLKGIGTSIMGALTPARLLVGGLGAVGIAAGAAYVSWISEQERLQASLTGVGRATGLTLAGLNRVAEAGARAGGISDSAGRGLAGQYAATGKIDGSVISGLVSQTRAYALTTGQELPDAGADLAKSFSDPVKGAIELNSKLGILDGTSLRLIQTMSAQGNVLGAQKIMMDKLGQATQGATDRLWTFKKGWDLFWDNTSNKTDAIMQTMQGVIDPTLEQRYAQANIRSRYGKLAGDSTDQAAYLGEEMRRQQQLASARARDVTSNLKSAEADDMFGSILPALAKQRDIINQTKKLEDVLGDPTIVGKMATSIDEARRALTALNMERITASGLTAREISDGNIAILSIKARTAAEKEHVEVLKAQQRAQVEGMDSTRAAAVLQQKLAELRAQNQRSAEDTLRDSRNSAALVGMRPYQAQQAEIDQRFRDMREQNGNQPAYDAAQALQKQSAAYQAVVKPLQDANDGLQAQIALLRVQAATFGQSTGAVTAAVEYQKMLTQAQQQGLTVTDQMRQTYRALSGDMGAFAQAQEDVARAQGRIVEGMDDLRGQTRGLLSGIFSDARQGKNVLDGLADKFGQMADSIFDKTIAQPLTDSLLGYMGKAGGGAIGGPLSAIFGTVPKVPDGLGAASAAMTASMTVNAASVVVNGGVTLGGGGGLPGLPGAGGGAPGASGGFADGTGGIGNPATVRSFPLGAAIPAAAGALAAAAGGGRGAGALPTGSIADYIRQAAAARGIDPNVALRVAQSEGGTRIWNLQSRVMKDGVQEPSFGPFQLYMKGGLGSRFQQQTGLNPADASAGPQGVDFALDYAKKNGWGSWFGAKHVGISNWQGIGQGAGQGALADPSTAARALQQSSAAMKASLGNASGALADVTQNANPATGAVAGLGDALKSIPAAAPGGGAQGGGGFLSWLFGGGGGGAPPVTTGTGGLYATGGFTGHGGVHQPAGIVHRGEVVWSQADVRRAGGVGVVEGMRQGWLGYASGGTVGRLPSVAGPTGAPRGGNTTINVIDNAGVKKRQEETTDANGNRRIDVVLDEMVADKIARGGTKSNRAMRMATGTTQPLTRR